MVSKEKRLALRKEVKKEKSKKRRARKAARARGEDVEVNKPIRIEDMREEDATIVPSFDEEVRRDELCDEFAGFESVVLGDSLIQPKLMIVVASEHPGKRTIDFLKEFTEVVPNLTYFKRKTFPIKKIVKIATERNFTALFVIQELRGCPDSMFIISLPEGPTTLWRLTSLRLGSEIKHGVPCNSEDNPELVFKNFSTRLGLRMQRQLTTLFPRSFEERGRRVITFHNQRDFIFFRHFRYVFKDIKQNLEKEKGEESEDEETSEDENEVKNERCALKEIGPRFTLKLRSVQLGTFNPKEGEYEYIWKADSQVSRKSFVL